MFLRPDTSTIVDFFSLSCHTIRVWTIGSSFVYLKKRGISMGSSFILLAGGMLIIIIGVVISVVSSFVSTVASFIGMKGDDEE